MVFLPAQVVRQSLSRRKRHAAIDVMLDLWMDPAQPAANMILILG